MQMLSLLRVSAGVVLVAILGLAETAYAQNFPLEITNIDTGTVGRIHHAYPGLTYNIRAAVIGGVYPYTFTVTNAPAGMAINSSTGEVNWTNPQSNASPTLTVTDAAGTQRQVTWSIAVGTAGWKFVDAVRGVNSSANGCSSNCGTGSITSPWRTLKDVYQGGAATDKVYFRAGTYGVLDMPRIGVGSTWEAVEWSGYHAHAWIAYPGERPLIDFGYQAGVENAPIILMSADATVGEVYVDGFETTRCKVICFQTGSSPTFRRMKMHDLMVGGNGTNASFIMTIGKGPGTTSGMVIQDNEFYNWPTSNGAACALKMYSQHKLLIENNIYHDGRDGVAIKGDVWQFTVRGDTYYNVGGDNIGGNMHGYLDQAHTTGEILFNKVLTPVGSLNYSVFVNQDSQALAVYVFRNTLVGKVGVTNTDSADGPFRLYNNVIVNSDNVPSHVELTNVSAPARVILTNNVSGAPTANVVDASGNLTAAYSQYLGTHGHQLGAGSTLQAPTGLRIVP